VRRHGFGEHDRQVAQIGNEIHADLAPQNVLGLADLKFDLGQVQFSRSVLLFGLEDLERGSGAEFDFAARAFQRLVGQIERLLLNLHVFARAENLNYHRQYNEQVIQRARDTGEELELPLSDFEQSSSSDSLSSDSFSTSSKPVWVAIRHAWLEQSPARATSVFILRDVSEAKELEHDREHLRRQQALVEMSALLAHEIRNPLGSLELFAGLLAEANLEAESHRWIEHVQAGLRTLSATVNNVLHLNNTPQPELAPTDAGQLLDWAYDFLLPLAKQARVEMQIINGLNGVTVHADRQSRAIGREQIDVHARIIGRLLSHFRVH